MLCFGTASSWTISACGFLRASHAKARRASASEGTGSALRGALAGRRAARPGLRSRVLTKESVLFIGFGISNAYHMLEAVALHISHEMDHAMAAEIPRHDRELPAIRVPGAGRFNARDQSSLQAAENRGLVRLCLSCQSRFSCGSSGRPGKSPGRLGIRPTGGQDGPSCASGNTRPEEDRHRLAHVRRSSCPTSIGPTGTTPDPRPRPPAPPRGTGTCASQSRRIGCTAMSRRVLSSSRRRCRPRRMASGAGAGPSTVTPRPRGAARPRSRASASAPLGGVGADDQRGEPAVGRPVAGPALPPPRAP